MRKNVRPPGCLVKRGLREGEAGVYFAFAVVVFILSCRRSLRNVRRSFSNRLLEFTCSSSFCSLKRTSRSASRRRDDFESASVAISASISRLLSIRVSERSLKYSWAFSTLSNGVAGWYSNVSTLRDDRKSVSSAALLDQHTTSRPRVGRLHSRRDRIPPLEHSNLEQSESGRGLISSCRGYGISDGMRTLVCFSFARCRW